MILKQMTIRGKLNTKSHGEGYLAFFEARLRKSGLYFLDEPETP